MAARTGRILLVVALLIALRVLGISALMPVLGPFAEDLPGGTEVLAGLAFGAYGLTMALMQVPMGAWSDRIGRKPVIIVGLLLYVAGNVMAYWAPSVTWLIAARLIEGTGAVSSVGLALLSDVVPEERRTFSIAIAGIGAGLSFLVGISLGAFAAEWIGVRGIFLASATLGLVLMVAVAAIVPGVRAAADGHAGRGLFATLSDRRGLAIDVAGFAMNLALTATMFALSFLAVGITGDPSRNGPLGQADYRTFLLIAVLVGGVLSIGAARAVDRRGKVLQLGVLASVLIGLGSFALLQVGAFWLFVAVGILYFAGHGAQSAALPSLVGKSFPGRRRGAAMGGYNAATYLGSFAGGLLGGALVLMPTALGAVLLVVAVVSAGLLAAALGRRRDGAARA